MTKKYNLISFGIVMTIWWIGSMLFPPMVIPSIKMVCTSMAKILSSPNLRFQILLTLERLLISLLISNCIGFIVGYIAGINEIFRRIIKPMISILQVTPPVALLIIAIMWFGFNGKPAIVIGVIAVLPTIIISVQEGILNIDPKLIQMGKTFNLSKESIFKNIVLPSIIPHISSGWKISLGTACKTVVMGEVLTTSTGIGGNISEARLNLEPEGVIAWTIITIIIFCFIDLFVKVLLRKGNELDASN
jgi:ABC-type nitrate/sulfonate/bicarbonate transport system permease component